ETTRQMDGGALETPYIQERRRRLAAERTLERTRGELKRAHDALVANADRLSRRYLSERETNLKLTERQAQVLQQRKEAAEKADRARRRLWHALEAMRDGFALFDAQGRLVAANTVYLQLFEADATIGPGSEATEMFVLAAEEGAFDIGDMEPEEWAEAHRARWDLDPIQPLQLHHYDGRVIRVQDRRAPDGDVVSLAVDVTAEAAHADALSEAKDQAEAMAQAKAGFLARMSHEIRTPMNGVMGLADLLIEGTDDAETGLYARTIRDSAEALLSIVNDTLDVSKLEAGKVELREAPFDMETLLIDCLRLVAQTAKPGVETGLLYPLDAPVKFVGDAGRIRQVVTNLLGNAFRFTVAGHVAIRVAATPADGGTALEITVEDTGPGIPVAEQKEIFEAFGQAASAAPERASEGTGLGLTISRGLAERMGGDLSLDSVPGRGSAFTLSITLPSEAAPAHPPLPASAYVPPVDLTARLVGERLAAAGVVLSDRSGKGPTILSGTAPEDLRAAATGSPLLVLGLDAPQELRTRAAACLPPDPVGADLVAAMTAPPEAPVPAEAPAPQTGRPFLLMADDNATNRLLLDRMLKDGPYDIRIVNDGQEALDAYRERRPDAVVLDISMPVMDGFDAAAAMQAHDPDCAPILALTAHAGEEIAERLKSAGFVAHLSKPLKKQALYDALDEALRDRPES
ncbi:MAG: ATP-binding protein, partial [Pseudomonadota bacterium]